MSSLAWGLPLAGVISLAGYSAGWLTAGGAAAAFLVGSTVVSGSGLPGGALLGLFFVSGSIFTQLTSRAGLTASESPKGGRNARQVWANGLWAAVGAGLVPWRPVAGWSMLTGALAAAQSDTWATEIGAGSNRLPKMITTGAEVARGTSGAITLRGTVGGVAGAVVLTAVAAVVKAPSGAATAGLAGGLVGMVGDSFLGATVQARFHCDACNQDTERRRHRCGRPARHISGWKWLDNDGVNLLATGAGGSAAALLSSWF